MTRRRTSWLVIVPILALGCGSSGDSGNPGGDGGSSGSSGGSGGGSGGSSGSSGGSSGGSGSSSGGTGDDGGPTYDGAVPMGNNVAPMIVDNGPPAAGGSIDVPFVSVTVCVPGTSTCQTIDHVSVDTGSSGLRIIASVLQSSIALPQAKASTGNPLAECFTYEDGYVWGSVRTADVKIAGEIAKNVPLHLVGDPAFSAVPGDCSSTGSSEDTVADFGANGIIGINQIVADCGDYCTTAQAAGYYSCAGTTCTDVGVPIANQVPNPIADFEADNNGALMEFPDVAASGAATVSGSLVFGIGTQSNNGLGSAKVLTVDQNGNFTTIFDGATMSTSYIDSGTNSLSFNDSAIPQCSGNDAGWYCPKSTLSLSAQNKGLNGVTSNVSFSIANTDSLFGNTNDSVFDDLGGPGSDNMSFAWGFPFFLGRVVYIGLDGATTPGGKGPYYAY